MSKRKTSFNEKDLDKLIRMMPSKERKRIKSAELTPDFVNQEIEKAKNAMKQDMSFGLPWVIAYIFCIWKFRYTTPTLIIFGIGGIYFAYAIYSRGTYGLNRQRLKVFEEIKGKL